MNESVVSKAMQTGRRGFLRIAGTTAAVSSVAPVMASGTALGAATSSDVAEVRKAYSSQTDLIDHDEHCSASLERLATGAFAVGQQVRMTRDDGEYALYTVSEGRDESFSNVFRMGRAGRSRLGTTDTFIATVDTDITHPTYTDAEAQQQSEFVERLDDDGTQTRLVVCAPHGGMVERYTDEQAEAVAARLAPLGASSWRCKGWRAGGGAYDRWHITSTDIHRDSFPLLDSVADRGFEYAVSFHGIGGSGVLVGGGAPVELKAELKAEIEARIDDPDVPVTVVTGGQYAGESPANFVNWLTADAANGIQIEQSYTARSVYRDAIVDAVVAVYERHL